MTLLAASVNFHLPARRQNGSRLFLGSGEGRKELEFRTPLPAFSYFRALRVPTVLPGLAVVAVRLHLKPLMTLLAANVDFHLPAPSQNRSRLFLCPGEGLKDLEFRTPLPAFNEW